MMHLYRELFTLPVEEKLKCDMRGGKHGVFVIKNHLRGKSVEDLWSTLISRVKVSSTGDDC
jgi:hypothetical protein